MLIMAVIDWKTHPDAKCLQTASAKKKKKAEKEITHVNGKRKWK